MLDELVVVAELASLCCCVTGARMGISVGLLSAFGTIERFLVPPFQCSLVAHGHIFREASFVCFFY